PSAVRSATDQVLVEEVGELLDLVANNLVTVDQLRVVVGQHSPQLGKSAPEVEENSAAADKWFHIRGDRRREKRLELVQKLGLAARPLEKRLGLPGRSLSAAPRQGTRSILPSRDGGWCLPATIGGGGRAEAR